MSERPTVTTLLVAAGSGDRAAEAELYRVVYEELKRIARAHLRRAGSGDTLNPSALVHEAWLKLAQGSSQPPVSSQHFYSLVARAMRQILLDLAKQRLRLKRGGDQRRTQLSDALADGRLPLDDMLALESALQELQACDAELAQLVEWRCFAGLQFQDIARLRGESERTLRRRWQLARAFLMEAMQGKAE